MLFLRKHPLDVSLSFLRYVGQVYLPVRAAPPSSPVCSEKGSIAHNERARTAKVWTGMLRRKVVAKKRRSTILFPATGQGTPVIAQRNNFKKIRSNTYIYIYIYYTQKVAPSRSRLLSTRCHPFLISEMEEEEKGRKSVEMTRRDNLGTVGNSEIFNAHNIHELRNASDTQAYIVEN